MAQTPSYLIQGSNIIVVISGKSYTIGKDHVSYQKIVDAIKTQQWGELEHLVTPANMVQRYAQGRVELKDGKVYWDGKEFTNDLAHHIIRFYNEGFPIDPLIKFMERLMKNPSKRSVDQCYAFVTKNNMPITPDGYILAFKKVRRGTYMDIHSGTIKNNVGATIEMDRNLVDDNPDSYCSAGLHFCSEAYLDGFGSKDDPVMIVRVDPADVVSVPKDANGSKARCCKYVVLSEVEGDRSTALSAAVIANDTFDAPVKERTPTKSKNAAKHPVSTKDRLFKLVRYSDNSIVEYYGLTQVEAQTIIDKRIKQKKARLKMIPL